VSRIRLIKEGQRLALGEALLLGGLRWAAAPSAIAGLKARDRSTSHTIVPSTEPADARSGRECRILRAVRGVSSACLSVLQRFASQGL
jgi:hypothetical protein